MKTILFAAVAAMAMLALPQVGHAQSKATSKNNTVSGAAADAAVIFMPGAVGGIGAGGAAGAAAASATGGFNQPQMILNTGSAPSTGTFNDCGIAWSAGLWVLTASRTSESEDCKSQRQAIFAAQHLGSKAIAFESMCAIESFRKAVERTNEMQCAQTVEERRVAEEKANRNRPAPAAAPMVTASTNTLPPNCRVVQPGNYISCQ